MSRTVGFLLAVLAVVAMLPALPARSEAPAHGSAGTLSVSSSPQIDTSERGPVQDPSLKHPPGAVPVETFRTQIAADCATLLNLASKLRTELNKSRTPVLSIEVIRKAREIQELARKVQQEMKQAVATNEGFGLAFALAVFYPASLFQRALFDPGRVFANLRPPDRGGTRTRNGGYRGGPWIPGPVNSQNRAERMKQAAGAAREKAMHDNAENLFKLASELSSELGDANAGPIHRDHLRKAAKIEKLARRVERNMTGH